ncbi:MAG: 4-vinyl reductase [Deltaproteobacteria bacterium]|jgi:predicted hydrocarbon binding protein|nr:4-vinyl reductase [Deltaproteobacteria bacterium]
MDNVFLQGKKHSAFSWDSLGDIREGRGDLGEEMPVLVYRLMQYTMLSVMSDAMGEEKANDYFRAAGRLAGSEFAKNCLMARGSLADFIAELQLRLRELKICVFRLEEHNPVTGEIVVTAAQDLDCSGLPVTNETVCSYDEGFIAGVFEDFAGKTYDVKEIDCWANGDRVCRFKGAPLA